jgi:acyl carrier protein
MAFEEEFKGEIGGEIPESEAEKLQTVGDVIAYIEGKAKK